MEHEIRLKGSGGYELVVETEVDEDNEVELSIDVFENRYCVYLSPSDRRKLIDLLVRLT
jgi:hypothetical protein